MLKTVAFYNLFAHQKSKFQMADKNNTIKNYVKKIAKALKAENILLLSYLRLSIQKIPLLFSLVMLFFAFSFTDLLFFAFKNAYFLHPFASFYIIFACTGLIITMIKGGEKLFNRQEKLHDKKYNKAF